MKRKIILVILLLLLAISSYFIMCFKPKDEVFGCPDPSIIIPLEEDPNYHNFPVEFSSYIDDSRGLHFTQSQLNNSVKAWACIYRGGREGPLAIMMIESSSHKAHPYGSQWVCIHTRCVCLSNQISACQVTE